MDQIIAVFTVEVIVAVSGPKACLVPVAVNLIVAGAGMRYIVSGPANKAMVFMRRMIPESLQAKINQLLTDDVPEDKQKRERGDIEAKEA